MQGPVAKVLHVAGAYAASSRNIEADLPRA